MLLKYYSSMILSKLCSCICTYFYNIKYIFSYKIKIIFLLTLSNFTKFRIRSPVVPGNIDNNLSRTQLGGRGRCLPMRGISCTCGAGCWAWNAGCVLAWCGTWPFSSDTDTLLTVSGEGGGNFSSVINLKAYSSLEGGWLWKTLLCNHEHSMILRC